MKLHRGKGPRNASCELIMLDRFLGKTRYVTAFVEGVLAPPVQWDKYQVCKLNLI